ncbi:MAG: ribonuclease [Clostridia bacterium]|nr:ribonuclease [Clostridia bacterium]
MEQEAVLELMRQKSYRPLLAEELIRELGVEDIPAFLDLLRRMELEGLIVRTRKDKYGLPEKMGLISGRLQANPKGFAFLIPLVQSQTDVFISASNLNGAMHGDLVLARFLPGLTGKRPEGEIIRVLQRAQKQVVGTYEQNGRLGFVVPDDPRLFQDIFIPSEETGGARHKDKVVVEITRWPERRRNPEGRVVEVLGASDAPGVDILSVVKKYGLKTEFPPEVLEEARLLKDGIAPEEVERRRDLRSWRLVTIDGADAKDLDDAVSLERLPNGNYRLGVHIADVSHYVREGSALDREAFERGTSVYLLDRVLPMLPPRLSNNLCSLNAGEDRLALSVVMEVDTHGEVRDYEIFPSIIRVQERMTYETVRRILVDEDPELLQRYAHLVGDFHLMAELCHILYRRRMRRGAIDFNFPEAKVILDEAGKPVGIIRMERSIAEQIIEEFMILANETVATHLHALDAPCVYRVHEEPAMDKLEELNNFLRRLGYFLKYNRQGRISPRLFQGLLKKVEGRPEERLVNTVLLRSLMHARYAPDCLGHFGLASKYYCHFTSPIRRYPDLVVHRILKELLEKGPFSPRREAALASLAERASQKASEREKAAEEAEREVLDLKKVEFMQRHVGDVFKGIVSGVVNYGFFVELENTVEGLVHISTIPDDYYHFNEEDLTLVGEHTGRTFRIGQEVEVQVSRVNVNSRQIDFELVGRLYKGNGQS